LREPGIAAASSMKVAVSVVGSETLTALAVTPVPLIATPVAFTMKLVPVRVAVNDIPGFPVFGWTVVNVGAWTGGACTVNVCALLVPPAVVTVTLRAVAEALAAIVNVTVKLVVLATFGVPTVMPVPLTFTVVAPITKFVPVRVTPTAVPATPVFGCTFVNVGS